jgi:hypothetical protein
MEAAATMEVSETQLAAWKTFRARRAKTAPDESDPWRIAGRRTPAQLRALENGWSIGVCWDKGRFEVIDGPLQGQTVVALPRVTLESAPGDIVKLKARVKRGNRGGQPKRIATDVKTLEGPAPA